MSTRFSAGTIVSSTWLNDVDDLLNKEVASTADYGVTGSSTAATNTAALTAALNANTEVIVEAGTYDPIIISQNDKTLYMQRGVIFKLPNNTISGASASGPSIVKISGNNITIVGDFTIDGNKANNSAAGFAADLVEGALHVTGDNARLDCLVHILNAYWVGLAVNGGPNSGDEVDRFYLRHLKVTEPYHYATQLWSVADWQIDSIDVSRGTTLGWKARVRVGSQTSSTCRAIRGHIGRINTNGCIAFEANAISVSFDTVQCAGGKFQDAEDCHINFYRADGSLIGDESNNSFAMISSVRCSVDTVNVVNHGSAIQAVAFSPVTDCHVNFLYIKGTTTNFADCLVRSVDGLTIDTMILRAPTGTGDGFHFDTDVAYVPQYHFTIGTLISTGHVCDVRIESTTGTTQLKIGWMNPDAVKILGTGFGPSGTFTWATGTASTTVTNSMCKTTSIITVMPVEPGAGGVVHSKGFYIVAGNGSFQVFTGDGTNTAANTDWRYIIHQPFVG